MYSISIISSYKDFLDIEDEWNALHEENNLSLFSSFSWIKCIIDSCEIKIDLFIFVVRNSSGIVKGIIPLQSDRRFKILGLKSISNSDTQSYEIIIDISNSSIILKSFFSYLKSNFRKFKYVEFSPISESHSPLIEFSKNSSSNFFDHLKESPYILCDHDFETFLSDKSKKFRKKLRNFINRYNREINYEVEKLYTASDNVFSDIVRISDGSWKGASGFSIGCNSETNTFFHHLTQTASAKKWLRIWFLKINGVRVAMEYHLIYKGIEYALRGDYLTDYKNYSPGNFLNLSIIRSLFDDVNVSIYDMCGDKYAYKTSWTVKARRYYRVLWIMDPFFRMLYRSKRSFFEFISLHCNHKKVKS